MAVRNVANEMAQQSRPSGDGGNEFRNGIISLVILELVIATIFFGVKAYMNWRDSSATVETPATNMSQPVVPNIEDDGSRAFWSNGVKTIVKQCVSISYSDGTVGGCASHVPGPKADYGTGFHTGADGRSRPNPPAGSAAGDGHVTYYQCKGDKTKLSAIQYNADGAKEIQSCPD